MTLPLSLLFAHFVGDFVLQSDWMAANKSKDVKALVAHVWVYSLCFFWLGIEFVMVTWLLHFLTNAITSRITSRLWFFAPIGLFYNVGGERYQMFIPAGGNRHWFFVVIGFDQLIHFVTLAWTLKLLS